MPGTEPAPLLLYLVKRVELAVRARLEEIVKPAGLTAIQYTALTVLERHDDMSSAQLARLSFVTAQSMADMITTLEGRRLIERHRDRADRRRLVVSLTAAGRVLLDRYRDEVAALEGDMIAGLTRQQTGELRAVLNTCYDNLSPAGHRSAVREPAVREPAVREPGVRGLAAGKPGVREPGVREPAAGKPAAVREPGVRELAVGDE
jgi:DNA-binding MarR family transcriptional regulator